MRRVHTPALVLGQIELTPSQAHHVRDVLRLGTGDELELFDDAGRTARAAVVASNAAQVTLHVEQICQAPCTARLSIASAIPKGERADWMIEKLSEMGVARFVPLATERSVVHPEGKNKFERWRRIATESAKQSHRTGTMQIDPLTPLTDLLANAEFLLALYLAPEAPATLLERLTSQPSDCLLLIGPEGGWTPGELDLFARPGIQPARLAGSILRIETAAIAAAVIVACTAAAASNPRENP